MAISICITIFIAVPICLAWASGIENARLEKAWDEEE